MLYMHLYSCSCQFNEECVHVNLPKESSYLKIILIYKWNNFIHFIFQSHTSVFEARR